MNRCFSLYYSLSLCVCVLFETAAWIACSFSIAQTHFVICDLLFVYLFIHSFILIILNGFTNMKVFLPEIFVVLWLLQWLRKTVATDRNFKKVLNSKLKLLRGFIHNACQRVQPSERVHGTDFRAELIELPTSCQKFSLLSLSVSALITLWISSRYSCFIHMHHSYGTQTDVPLPLLSKPDCSEQHVLIYYGSKIYWTVEIKSYMRTTICYPLLLVIGHCCHWKLIYLFM